MKEILDVALNINEDTELNDIDFDDNGDFLMTDTIGTAIRISLFTDKRATKTEEPNPANRGGWWGNIANEEENFQIGSKLWLLKQSKLTQETLNLALAYSKEALIWLINKNYVDEINVTGTLSIKERAINLRIKLTKDNTIIADERIEFLQITTGDIN